MTTFECHLFMRNFRIQQVNNVNVYNVCSMYTDQRSAISDGRHFIRNFVYRRRTVIKIKKTVKKPEKLSHCKL